MSGRDMETPFYTSTQLAAKAKKDS